MGKPLMAIHMFVLTGKTSKMLIPKGAAVLSVGVDGSDEVCIWALVDAQANYRTHDVEYRTFHILDTGEIIPRSLSDNPESFKFLGTVTLSHGMQAVHVIEEVS